MGSTGLDGVLFFQEATYGQDWHLVFGSLGIFRFSGGTADLLSMDEPKRADWAAQRWLELRGGGGMACGD